MTTYGKHSISYLRPTMWAKLSKDIRKSETVMNLVELIRCTPRSHADYVMNMN